MGNVTATVEGLSYFDGGTWRKTITRDERFFCAHLYRRILEDKQKGVRDFVELINKRCGLNLNLETYWELGYEVCFYRDLYHWQKHVKQSNPGPCVSNKRTFDLCLFSGDVIVIIEAKAFQGFETEQMNSFVNDKRYIASLLKGITENNVYLVGLACKSYIESPRLSKEVRDCFHEGSALFSWDDLVQHFKDKDGLTDAILERADQMYHFKSSLTD